MKKVFLKMVIVSALTLCFAVPVVDAATLKAPPANTGLVGYWSFNEGTSTHATDFSGNGNDGTLNNIASTPTATSGWGSGKLGGGLNFDGTDDRVTISGSAFDFANNQDFALVAWIKTSGDSEVQTIIEHRNATAPHRGFAFWVTTAGTVHMSITNTAGTSVNIITTQTVTDNVWHHVVAVYDRDGLGELYIDGVLATSSSISSANGTLSGSGSNFYIGDGNITIGASSLREFKGTIDDVRVYSRTLSVSEIAQLYQSGSVIRKTVSNSGLVGYWSFNEGTSTRAGDASGNGNNGTLTNMDATTDWVNGKLGKALDFDGSNDYVSISDSSIWDFGTGEYTLSAWVKMSSSAASGDYRMIIARDQSPYYYQLNTEITSGKVELYSLNAGANLIRSDVSVADNRWHHVVGMRRSGVMYLYIDGVQQSSSRADVQNVSGSSAALQIGRRQDGSHPFLGQIDDVRIYNRALTAAEVTKLYQSNETRVASSKNNFLTEGLVGIWSFDARDMNYTSVYDRSGRGNNLLTSNIATSSRVPGKLGQALSFDGSSSYVYKSTAPVGFPTGNSPISYSVWVKPPAISTPRVIFFYGANSASMSYYIDVARCAANSFSAGKWGSTLHCDSTPYTPGEWYHLVLVSDGATSRFYKNGTLVSSIATTLNLSATYMEIGRYSGGEYFNGVIDDVRVYNRALSASEVQLLYGSGR